MRSGALALAAAALLACPGCATLLAGGPSLVDVDVEGPDQGVELIVKGTETPDVQRAQGRHHQLWLDRGSSYAVMASAEGYRADIGRIRTVPNPAVYLDVLPAVIGALAGNFLGNPGTQLGSGLTALSLGMLLLDRLSHADSKHEVNYVSLKLVREATP